MRECRACIYILLLLYDSRKFSLNIDKINKTLAMCANGSRPLIPAPFLFNPDVRNVYIGTDLKTVCLNFEVYIEIHEIHYRGATDCRIALRTRNTSKYMHLIWDRKSTVNKWLRTSRRIDDNIYGITYIIIIYYIPFSCFINHTKKLHTTLLPIASMVI